MTRSSTGPSVTVAIPVLNEEAHLGACLDALAAQTYPGVVEVLVVDGGSTDATRSVAAGYSGVRVLDNSGRIQSAGLNVALAEAVGEILVRVDGHCTVAPDYVERCVEALERTGAAMVGGAMRPVATGWKQRGIAAAMASPAGAGPARFHVGGASGWVDTVYLGAYRTEFARRLGGYATDVGVNEDAELAIRMGAHGGVWFDETIRSTYLPRSSVRAVARQFYRYGRSRAATVRRHPGSVAPRQLAAPALVLAFCTPWRRQVAVVYGGVITAAGLGHLLRDRESALGFTLALPTMHLFWGTGFLRGLAFPRRSRTQEPPDQKGVQACCEGE
ncbi:MAG: glycosyltransferase family 2 protein [Acidimicrobiales bacterium]